MAEGGTTASRLKSLAAWFETVMAGQDASANTALTAVSGDASFRRYFRVRAGGQSYILVDVPPGKESCHDFVQIARYFFARHIPVPQVYAVDQEQGFMCLEDFGDSVLWKKLDEARSGGDWQMVASLYHKAIGELLEIQSCSLNQALSLPDFDEKLLRQEMELFSNWFCRQLLGLHPEKSQQSMLDDVFAKLIASARRQVQVCVHRDYHSRNLMVLEDGRLGILDFQDAVSGPCTYDPVSLLRDCYISWPREQVLDWALEYAAAAHERNIIPQPDPDIFLLDFDLMGMQRHLKAIGIFARLYLRDSKPGYLGDIPRTLNYVLEVARDREGFSEFAGWLEKQVVPAMTDVPELLLHGGGS